MGGMCFRSLTAFNKALAKQIWRVINSPASLLAWVLKARYFKNVDIMAVGLGSNPSYMWCSLLWSRDIIKDRLCWRVGNGKSILAFLDPWIPGLPGYRSSMPSLTDLNFKVANLIHYSGCWNSVLVRHIFPRQEVEAILDIPLNRRGSEDQDSGTANPKACTQFARIMECNSWAPPQFQSSHPDVLWWKRICIYPQISEYSCGRHRGTLFRLR